MMPPAPRHILMTADTVGGVWTFAMELCQGLCAGGTKVTLVTMGGLPSADQKLQADAIAGLMLVPTSFRLEWMTGSTDSVVASGDFLLDLARDVKPDLVHVNTYYHAGLPFGVPVLLTAHSCVTSWWKACRGTVLPLDWDRYAGWVREAVAAADMLVAPTATYLREFQHLHGRARAARYIHNGRKPDAFRRAPKANRVLAAGRLWDEGKNIAFLGRALQGSGIEFVVAGSTQGPSGEVASLKGARLLGPLPPAALARAMSEAAIFAAPARYEPFGLGVLEAALSGCALVLSDIPSLRELWEGVAHFIPPDDDAQWRKVIAYLTTDRERAIADGLAAQRRARRFEAGVMVEQYRQAYADTISAAAGEEKAA